MCHNKSLLPFCFLCELHRTFFSKLIGRITLVPGRQRIKIVHLLQTLEHLVGMETGDSTLNWNFSWHQLELSWHSIERGAS